MSERQEQQASLAFDAGTPGVAGEAPAIARTWDRSLTHRMRVLLHTAPLHDLRQGDNLHRRPYRARPHVDGCFHAGFRPE